MSDNQKNEFIRSSFDPVVEQAPVMPEFDEILALASEIPTDHGSRVPLGFVAACVSALVVVVVGSTIWFVRGDRGDAPLLTQDSASASQAWTSTTLSSAVAPADDRIYALGDCPAAAHLLIGGHNYADGLPQRGQTERARVEGMIDDVTREYVDSSTGVVDVRAIPRNGEVWYRLNDGAYAVELAEDYQFEFVLSENAPCPTAPMSVDGVPVLHTRRTDDQANIETASTDGLQLDIVDTYPIHPGIDTLFLRNTSTESIDVGGWTIGSYGYRKDFTMPDTTVILPGESIAIYQFTEARGAPCPEDTPRAFFHCNALGQDTVTGDMLFPNARITVVDSDGNLILESHP